MLTEKEAKLKSMSQPAKATPQSPTPTFTEEKRCCVRCDMKKKCHVCKTPTLYACSDCQIDLSATVYVCSDKKCRDHHETHCTRSHAALQAQNAELREALEWIAYGKAHIGNDANGNVFGPPDAVMCRNRAIQALTRAEGGK